MTDPTPATAASEPDFGVPTSFPPDVVTPAPSRFVQVGWYGPYGIIPGGMDNDPAPHWRPLYVER